MSNLQATSTTTFNNLNDFSRFCWLNITSLNDNTNNLSNHVYSNIPAYYDRIVSVSPYSVLNMSYLQATSTTTFNYLNSLSTNSTLSINNLNSFSGTSSLSIYNLNNKTNVLIY
jgi:hypothetical protein